MTWYNSLKLKLTTTQVVEIYNSPILCQGEFSSGRRTTSFLIALSRYQLSLQHHAGSANLPSDFASQNTSAWKVPLCVICSFILETENSVVILNVFVEDISENGRCLLLTIRPDLCCICAHLKRPPSIRRKAVSEHHFDFYRWLVLQRQQLLSPPLNWSWYHGTFLMDFLSPSKASFTTLQSTAITCVSDSCHTCTSKSSNTPSPTSHQMIHLKSWVCHLQSMSPSCLRECTNSLTASCIVPDDKSDFCLWHPCLTGHSLIALWRSQWGLNMLTLYLNLSSKSTPVHY